MIPRIRLRRTGGAISRNGPGVRRNRQARPVRCTGQVASGLHERGAHIFHRSAVLCHFWHLVVNSGENFEPEGTVPVPAGGFVRRVAHTPHYDGVKKGGKEPAVIGIFGQAPIEFKLTDPTKPAVREV